MIQYDGDMGRPLLDRGDGRDEDGDGNGPVRGPTGHFDGDRLRAFRVGILQRQVGDEPGRRDQGFTPVDAPGMIMQLGHLAGFVSWSEDVSTRRLGKASKSNRRVER